jgi:hypothetical protein
MANVRTTLIGGVKVTEEQVRATETPPETRSHVPLPHGEFLNMVDRTLGGFGWDITEQRYALEGGKIEVAGKDVRYDTARLFGVLKIQREDVAIGQDYQLAIGIRNSHDKTMSAGMVAGLVVMVCSNLDFMGDFKTSHKHSVNVRKALPSRLNQLAGEIEIAHTDHTQLVESYKKTNLGETMAHDLLVRLCDARAFPWAYAPKILKEYRKPRHEEFEQPTMWGFNNATTEILKDRNIRELPTSMARFHKLGKELVTQEGTWVDKNQETLSLN